MHARIATFASAVLAAAAASAAAGLDASIGNGNVVTGTLDSPSDTETFRATCPAGAALTVVVNGVRKRGATAPKPTFVVLDGDDAPVGPDRITSTAAGASAKAIPLTATGEYRVVVSAGAGAPGDFQLAVTWKTPAPPAASGTLAGVGSTFDFSADAGAVATFDVSQSPSSKALPRLFRCTGPGFDHYFTAASTGAKRHRAAGVALPATGVYTLLVVDEGVDGGLFRGRITVKPPRPVRTKIVLTNAVLGAATDRFASVTTIGRSGGVASSGGGGLDPIAGASVSIGPGALANPVSVVVGTGVPIAPQQAQQSAVGRTVVFGPEGLKFATPATLTIPFDPSSFGGDFTGLKVFTRDARGRVTEVPPPLTVDALAGTVSFPSSHFSSYRAFGPTKPVAGDLNGDGFADLVLPAPGHAEEAGAVYVYFGRADFLGNPPAAPDATFTAPLMGQDFGCAVAVADVNGDGQPDLVVGAKYGGPGAAYVFFGGPGFAGKSSSQADVTLSGSSTDAHFGATIVVADVTGDGAPDVIVAAPYTSNPGIENGVVYVFKGGASIASLASDDASVIALTGAADQDFFGASMAAGDVSGDGLADVVVGADQLGSGGAGAVFVFVGGPGLVSQPAGSGPSVFVFTGTGSFDHFGDAVAIGDFDADGSRDLAVGAPLADDGSTDTADSGAVYVFFGGAGFTGRPAAAADRAIRVGGNTADQFGFSLASGDVTGNATADLIAAAPGYDAAFGDEGKLYSLAGGPGFVSGIDGHSAFAPSDQYGILLQPVDLDGDGRAEIIAASPDHGVGAGQVEVRFGPTIGADRVLVFDGLASDRLGGRN